MAQRNIALQERLKEHTVPDDESNIPTDFKHRSVDAYGIASKKKKIKIDICLILLKDEGRGYQ